MIRLFLFPLCLFQIHLFHADLGTRYMCLGCHILWGNPVEDKRRMSKLDKLWNSKVHCDGVKIKGKGYIQSFIESELKVQRQEIIEQSLAIFNTVHCKNCQKKAKDLLERLEKE